ncbi:MBL fold metallo-hydrolase [uncultured Lacinutrix sp.]|uniref:ComEC/Rec2 family competence protein n=1 Tax=uncultured Lacinutrix sp. TaxID=574032 RepID=UPI00262CF2A0|nr:MBL fold metallo-hydrolase [uncultured Lacinutrix sp.]
MINLEFLPARFGDCIWIEYGDNQTTHRILIDGGTAGTRHNIRKRIEELPEDQRSFDLMVVTHIDKDHIAGILGLLEDEDELPFKIKDFWFNAFKHLPEEAEEDESFGAKQAERLTESILKHTITWNGAFNGGAVVMNLDELPEIEIPGGMKLTLLSPTAEHLMKLRPKWIKEVEDAGMIPGGVLIEDDILDDDEGFGATEIPNIDAIAQTPFNEDTSVANGSSIAFLAEFEETKILFCGDAFPSQVLQALNVISPEKKIDLDLVKISHHGSSGSTNSELLEKLNCRNYVISTSGSTFHHPKADTISRIIKSSGDGAHLIFNYKSDINEIWDLNILKTQHNYTTTYPPNGEEGIKITL